MRLIKGSDRNTQCHYIRLMGVVVYFSYETPIAFEYRGEYYRRRNVWGPTTGRHMKEMGVTGSYFTEMEDGEAFNKLLDRTIWDAAMEQFKARLAA